MPRTPLYEYESEVLKFVNTAIEEGDAFLRAQPGYDQIPKVMKAIFNECDAETDAISRTSVNHLGRICLDLSAGMTDVRPFWEYRTSNHSFDRQAEIYGKLAQHWWTQRQVDMRFVDAMKYAFVSGAAYLHVTWDPNLQDFLPLVEDARDVIPIRPTSTMNIQDCMGVTIRREHTVNYILNQYPAADKDKVRAEKDGSVTSMLQSHKMGRILLSMSPFQSWLKQSETALQVPKIPTCTLYTTYLRDPSTNDSDKVKHMGEWHFGPDKKGRLRTLRNGRAHEKQEYCPLCADGRYPHAVNNWSYAVEPGEPLYPFGRFIVSTSYGVLYDGPMIYWHGAVIPFPLVKICPDPFPWSWFGKAVGQDIASLQDSLNARLRAFDDWTEKKVTPDVIADKNSVSRAELKKLNPRKAGAKYRQNPLAGKGMQLVYPEDLGQEFWTGINFLVESMNTISGVQSIQALLRLNQMPSSDTIEQVMATLSPSVRLRSRVLESSMRELATILAYDFSQFYTLPMRLTILGSTGVTKEDFDYDPQTLVPDYVHKEDYDNRGNVTPSALSRGTRPRFDRTKELLRQFSFHIAPGSLLESASTTEKLVYLNFFRAGALDLWTVLDKFSIPNIGEPPAGTIIERLQAQRDMGVEPIVSSTGRKASGQRMPMQKSSGAVSESG